MRYQLGERKLVIHPDIGKLVILTDPIMFGV